jgi:uncharacterized protein
MARPVNAAAETERARRAEAHQLARPLPDLVGLVGRFHELLASGTLHLQRCEACARWQYPARECCALLPDHELAWSAVSGRGRVFSWTVTHQALHPAFVDDVPYVTALVELNEGPRVVGRLNGVGVASVVLGLPVRVEPITVAGVAVVSFVPEGLSGVAASDPGERPA